ncbi:hypothetical protein PsorP6_015902 [Peronosclerospora sorghi]|uniref:Uncharacterized protein n=1 Tax=Peronosclerospora sorghi TaxID=230839 RepID=A0ACC0WPF0_9STRA|nr:hypothetical protein PsorP6_015902 [Peronosclerospora sorghi]
MYFEAYMRGFRISADDARSLREDQARGSGTFKLLTASVPAENLELYITFFGDELPSVDIYRSKKETIPAVPAPLDFTPPVSKRSTSAAVISTKLAHTIQRLSLSKQNRTRFSGGELIPVGRLLKMDGDKDRDVILFNEVAAENAFGDVTQY